MTPKVPTSDTGTATPGMAVAQRLWRKTKITRTTRTMEMTRVISTSRTEARMVMVRSCAASRLIAGGIEARSKGSTAFTRSTVSMIFADGWRYRSSSTIGFPLINPALRTFTWLSTTVATSDK